MTRMYGLPFWLALKRMPWAQARLRTNMHTLVRTASMFLQKGMRASATKGCTSVPARRLRHCL